MALKGPETLPKPNLDFEVTRENKHRLSFHDGFFKKEVQPKLFQHGTPEPKNSNPNLPTL